MKRLLVWTLLSSLVMLFVTACGGGGGGGGTTASTTSTTTTTSSTTSTTAPVPTNPTITAISPGYALTGTSVTITGTNLSGATVKFGTTTANVTSTSATQIQTTVPSLAQGGYVVTVTTGSGTATTPFVVTTADTRRVVLTWTEASTNLDAHLFGPESSGSRFHVYFGNRAYPTNSGQVVTNPTRYLPGPTTEAVLENDAVSLGPETVLIFGQRTTSPYTFYVQNWSGNSFEQLSASGATVRVYDGNNTLLKTFNVPVGSGIFWTVFEMNGRDITEINIVDNTPLSKVTPGSHIFQDLYFLRNLQATK